MKPLQDGGTIGVGAFASSYDMRSEVERGVEWWESRGYRVKLAPGVYERDDYVAGDARGRADDLHALFADPDVDVVQTLQGGFGSSEMLSHLDFDLIAANPKPFVGYSDITSLPVPIRQRAGFPTFYGYGLMGVGDKDTSEFTHQRLLPVLRGDVTGEVPRDPDDPYVRVIAPGRATAPLVGGCLWLLLQTLGTPWELQTDGAILFFEDTHAPPYYVDGQLTQLRHAGKLDNLAGVVVGDMHKCDYGDLPRDVSDWRASKSIEDVLEKHLEPLGVPVLYKLPLGHGKHQASIPLGVRCTLDADARTLTVDESPFTDWEGGRDEDEVACGAATGGRCVELGFDRDRLRREQRRQQRHHRQQWQDRRYLPPRHGQRHRLPQPIRRVQPGRLQRLRVHLSGPRPVRQQSPLRRVLRQVLARFERRQDLDVQDATERQVERRQAPYGCRRCLDDQHRHQIQGRSCRGRGGARQPRQERDRPQRDDTRRQLRRGARADVGTRSVPAVLHPPAAHLGEATGQQGRRTEDVPEQRPGRRIRPVHPRQVPEEPDHAVQAQRLLLGHEAEDRRVRAAAVLERRCDGHGAEGPQSRCDRSRARYRDEDPPQLGLRGLGSARPRPDGLHHQLESAEEEPP